MVKGPVSVFPWKVRLSLVLESLVVVYVPLSAMVTFPFPLFTGPW